MAEPSHEKTDRERLTVHRIEISYRTILAVVLTVAAIWLLNVLLPILVVLVMALILVGTLSPAVGWLERHRVKRPVAIAIIFIGCAIVVGGSAW